MRTVLTTSSLVRVSNIPVSCLYFQPFSLTDNEPYLFLSPFATFPRIQIDKHARPEWKLCETADTRVTDVA